MISRTSSTPVWMRRPSRSRRCVGPRRSPARLADAAGLDRRTALPVRADAIERFGDQARGRGLAHPSNAGEQEGMRDPPALDRVGERLHHRILADQFGRRSAAGTCGQARDSGARPAFWRATSGKSRPKAWRFVVRSIGHCVFRGAGTGPLRKVLEGGSRTTRDEIVVAASFRI